MRRSVNFILVLSLISFTLLLGCEAADSAENGTADELTELKKVAVQTVCEFGGEETLSVGKSHSVTIKNGSLKVLKEKDLVKKNYSVKVEVNGKNDPPFTGVVKNEGSMVVSLSPKAAGNGSVSVFLVDLKKNKETALASCSFEAAEEDTEGTSDIDADADSDTDADSDSDSDADSDSDSDADSDSDSDADSDSDSDADSDSDSDADGSGGGGGGGGDYSGEKWCIGEDTNDPPEEEITSYCSICGKREFKVQNWQNNGPCLKAWSDVASSRGDSTECREAVAEWQGFCCAGYYEHPVRKQCADNPGPYESVDLCADGCFPSKPATAGVYSLQAGGPLAPWVKGLGNRAGTCYADDGGSPNALVWTCRRVYYLLKYGHLPPAQANEAISWWRGSHALSAKCGCDGDNTNNPYK